MTNPAVYTSLFDDKRQIETELELLLRSTALERGPVFEAMRYAVLGCGQRLRPLLSIRAGRMFDTPLDATLTAAASVEIFHCASLIIDDLPCMDDSEVRRDRPSVHMAYGESTAILAAFGLVALAARCLVNVNAPPRERESRVRFQFHLLSTLGVDSLIAGQQLDLVLSGETRERNRKRMTELKTVPLFEVAVRAGLISSAATAEEEERLLRFGRCFGSAYQTLDDLLDGEIEGESEFESAFAAALQELTPFGARARELRELVQYLHGKLDTENRSRR